MLTLFAGFTAFPKVLDEHMRFTQIPQIFVAVFLLIAVSFSWLYPFWAGGISMTFKEYGKVILLFLIIILLGREPRYFRLLLWTVSASVTWMALHAITQDVRGFGFGGQTPRPRGVTEEGVEIFQAVAYGQFDDPNQLCMCFIMAIPLLFAEYRAVSNPVIRLIVLALIPLIAYGAWLTNSRGGMIGIFGMIAGWTIARTKGVRRWLTASVTIGLVTVLLPARGSQLGAVDMSRVNAWGDGLDMFARFPILGVGYSAFPQYTAEGLQAHNSYLNALAETGLFGYMPWFLLMFLTLVHLRRTLSLKEFIGRRDRHYLGGLFSSLCGYLTALYFLSLGFNFVLYVLLALTICGIIIACYEHNLYAQVFGNLKRDLRWGLFWCLASIPFLWITVRITNKMGGR
jgi:hypothetical protein